MTPETNPLSNLSSQERIDLAQNPNTPLEILTLLARDENWGVRCRVALNPNTPPEILTILARDENKWVRCGVERNPNATREVVQTVRAYEFHLEFNKTH